MAAEEVPLRRFLVIYENLFFGGDGVGRTQVCLYTQDYAGEASDVANMYTKFNGFFDETRKLWVMPGAIRTIREIQHGRHAGKA